MMSRKKAVITLLCVLFLTVQWLRGGAPPSQRSDGPEPRDYYVGFHLGTSYGTVTIAYPDGTTVNVAKVPAEKQYLDAVYKLSLRESEHLAPPYSWPADSWNDRPRVRWRNFRKFLGCPASPEVGSLSTLVKALREEAEKFLGREIESAVATVPHLRALYDDDLYDIFEHVGLQYTQIIRFAYEHQHLTYSSNSVVAANNLGLCANATHPDECNTPDPEQHFAFLVEYNKDSLNSGMSKFYSARSTYERHSVQLGMGSDFQTVPRTECPWGTDRPAAADGRDSEEVYWQCVKDLLADILAYAYDDWNQYPEHIIMFGESATDPKMRVVIEEVFRARWSERPVPPFLDAEPEYMASKGAAEFARRAPYWPPIRKDWSVKKSNALADNAMESPEKESVVELK